MLGRAGFFLSFGSFAVVALSCSVYFKTGRVH